MNYDYENILAAARKAKGAEWKFADALVEEVPKGTRSVGAVMADVSRRLKDDGLDYSGGYLQTLREAAIRFDYPDRSGWLTPANAAFAGSPEIVEEAVEQAREDGRRVPSQRDLKKVRKAHRKATKALPAKGPKGAKPSRSEVRRQADVLNLASIAGTAEVAGGKYLEAIADTVLLGEERDEALHDVRRVLNVWQQVEHAIENPVAQEAENILRSV